MASVAGVSIAVGILLLLFSSVCCICSLVRGHRQSRANAATDAATASAALTLRPQPTVSDKSRHSEQQQRRTAPEGGPRRASPTSGLPSFAYNRSVRHNVMSGGSEEAAATCSVCLGALQVGETVRLLPVCLHLYHVECIDPWLDAHSSCPLCRSGTDSTTMDGGLLPPV
ncbi:unnamed protein product [Miscanthus lutarioriparius]|uniref:RING-type E3 ubiquitin transferase n=1 Tax=Miscanthus lutarioriparius TaxID=422564 RepID=A0A811SEP0_9POAL|nr:unnamed protein product [Miscanthus lutarioriparius]